MNICLTIPFPSTELALLAYDVLNVDKELKRSKVQRTIKIEEKNLVVFFLGEELKGLRVAVNAFIKNVKLIVKTVKQLQEEPV